MGAGPGRGRLRQSLRPDRRRAAVPGTFEPAMETSERTHLLAARAGNPEAFQSLVDPYRRELLVHCYRFFGSVEDAEDMVQECLLRAWRRLETYEGRAS